MDTALLISISAVIATTGMTMFSYALSYILNLKFREPYNLAYLMKGKSLRIPSTSTALGWLAHYGVGFAFVVAYYFIWDREVLMPTYLNGAIIGFVSGLVAVGVWAFALNVHPRPPLLSRPLFYAQLVPAHVIFAIIATSCYRYAA